MNERQDPELPASLGAYQIERILGRGLLGQTAVARHSLHGTVALRLLPIESGCESVIESPEFEAAVSLITTLGHTGLVDVLEIGWDAGLLYVAEEILEGRTLADLIAERGRIDFRVVRPIMAQVLGAVEFAHQRDFAHLDVKPSNVSVLDRGLTVKLADCGLPHLLSMVAPERFGAFCRCPYAAPEMPDPRRRGAAADIYGVGVLLHEALTGRLPAGLERANAGDAAARFGLIEFDLQDPDARNRSSLRDIEGLPESLADAIEACLHADPSERPLTMRDLRVAFGFARPPDLRIQTDVAGLLRRAALEGLDAVGYEADDASGLPRCPGCGWAVRPGSRTCPSCGLAQAASPPLPDSGRTRGDLLETEDVAPSAPTAAAGPPVRPETALRTGSARTDFFVSQGDRLMRQGRRAEAIRAYETAAAEPQPHAIAFRRLGAALALDQRRPEAVRAYERALELSPSDYDAMHDLARLLCARGDVRRASDLLERVVKAPVPPELRLSALTHLGSALARAGRLAEAVEAWEAVLAEGPPNAPVEYSLGVAYATLGDAATAERHWKAALEADPSHTESRIALSQARSAHGAGFLGPERTPEGPGRGASLLTSALEALGSMLSPRRPL